MLDSDLIVKSYNAIKKGQSYAFATVVEATPKGTPRKAGAKMIVLEDGSLFGSIGGGRNENAVKEECLKAIRSGKPQLATYDYFGQTGQSICGGRMKVFIEPFAGIRHLIICGAGHIALPLSLIAKMLNFRVSVIDNRKEFAQKRRFPHVDKVYLGAHAKVLQKLPIDPRTFIMIVTQGNEHDFECLKAVIETDAGYIGVISSLAKKIKFLKRLKALGVSAKSFGRIHIPAGLDIGAQTPEEIAVSITAQMIQSMNIDSIGTAKFKVKTK